MAETSEQDLRRRILDTARHLLVSEGYSSLTMRKIARAIGYSATSIYLSFDGKDALVHALIDEGMDRLYDRMQTAATRHPDDPAERLVALCRAYLDFGLGQPEYYEIMFMLHPERMARYPAESYRRARRNLELIVTTLDEGGQAGVFRVERPRVAASAIWAALHGTISLIIARRVDVRIGQEDLLRTALVQAVSPYGGAPDLDRALVGIGSTPEMPP